MTDEPRDPFEDLGSPPSGNGRSAAERIAEHDRLHPEQPPKKPEVTRPSARYSWLIGIAFFLVVVIASINAIPNKGEGLRGVAAGHRLPQFAAPLVLGNVTGDVNVRQPHSGGDAAGKVPACELHGKGIINVCQLEKRPLVLTFIFDRGADCNPQVDRVERARRRLPGVNFATVYFSHKDRDELQQIVRRRGWRQPVALDRDGGLTNLYNIGICPSTVFAYKGGRVWRTKLGQLTEDQIAAGVRHIRRGPG